jgi:hypothetical protein
MSVVVVWSMVWRVEMGQRRLSGAPWWSPGDRVAVLLEQDDGGLDVGLYGGECRRLCGGGDLTYASVEAGVRMSQIPKGGAERVGHDSHDVWCGGLLKCGSHRHPIHHPTSRYRRTKFGQTHCSATDLADAVPVNKWHHKNKVAHDWHTKVAH